MKHALCLGLLALLTACEKAPSTPAAAGPAGSGMAAAPSASGGPADLPKGESTYHFGVNPAQTKITFESKTEVTNIIGSTNRVSGTAVIDFDAGTGHCKLVVPVESLNTGMPDRDRSMFNKNWLNLKEFPTIEFQSTKAAFVPPNHWKVDGAFTLHGVAKEISIDLEIKRISEAQAKAAGLGAGSWIKVKSSFPVALADHGIKIDQTAIATVDKVWNVSLDLFATTTAPAAGAPAAAKPDDSEEGPKLVRVKAVSEEGIEGAKYKFGKKPQLATISAVSETEVETITAQTSAVAGILGLDREKGTGKVRLRVPVDHLKTGIDLRDEHMKGPMWLDSKANPDLLFESTKVSRKEGNFWTVEGNFTMHGVAKPITADVRMREIPVETMQKAHWGEKPGLGFDTTIKLKLSDFGVKVPDQAKAKVKDEWTITISLVALLED